LLDRFASSYDVDKNPAEKIMADDKAAKTLAYPAELKYVKTHEYVKVQEGIATMGVTAFAADQLGDVTFVELPKVGQKFKKEEKFGVIESVKSVSDLFMPLGGEITEINERLDSEPELVNLDCYGDGWMIKVKMDSPSDLDDAMSAEQYQEFIVD
jgi:glycine cleavage system H protein